MTQILHIFLTLLLLYGYPVVALIVFVGTLGIPLPVTSILLAAGSFSSEGILNGYVLVATITITAVIGDILGYFVGLKVGKERIELHGKRLGFTATRLLHVDVFFHKWGGGSIFISRWLITPLCVPINLIAGIEKYSFKKFLLYVISGELLWASMYTYLGYIFGANWQVLLDYISNAPLIFALLFTAFFLLFLAVRMKRRGKIIHLSK